MADARHRRRLFSGLGLVLIAVLFVGTVVISNALLRGARLDLTEDQLFTLSEGSREVVRDIDEPLTLRFYFSDRLAREIPSIGIYAQRVRDLLEEFAARADGKIRLEVYDPEPFSDAEDRAVGFGLQGVPVDQGGDLVYFGLAGTNSTDDRQVIPFFDQSRERFLEYDIARVIYNLAHPEKRVVGLITSLPVAGTPYAMRAGQDDSWIIYGQMKEFFEVRTIAASDKKLPDDLDVLVLIHPKGLAEDLLYAIDQYVLKGGKLLAFVDPHSEVSTSLPQQMTFGDHSSDLDKLLGAWGVEIPDDVVAGDLAAARRVQVPSESDTRVAAVDYPLWPALTAQNLDRTDPITSQLSQINLATPGLIRMAEDGAAEIAPLMFSSDQGGTVEVAKVQGRTNPLEVLRSFSPSEEPITFAARVSGKVKSAFPDGPPTKPAAAADTNATTMAASDQKPAEEKAADAEAAEPAPAGHVAEAAEPINVVVVADVDMLADPLWVRVQDFFGQRLAVPLAQNGGFFINALDNLSGSSALIGLRSRGTYQRPFTEIQGIQRQAEARFRAKEQQLLQTLEEAQTKLTELQGETAGDSTAVLTPEQRDAIERFRTQIVSIRRELRDVQHALRSDVENLQDWIRAINIGLIPVLVAVVAIVLALARRAQRARPRAA